MDLSKLLNGCDEDSATRPPTRTSSSTCRPRQDEESRLPTSTFAPFSHHHHAYQPSPAPPTALTSLTPLQSALPELTRHCSDYSESTHSPTTPEYVSEATPVVALDPDHRRHRPADPKRPGPPRRDSQSIQGSLPAPPNHMDPYAVNDFMGGVGSPTFQHPQLPQLQPAPGQLPLPQTHASPTTSLTSLDQSTYSAPARSALKAPTKKNSHPCPVAKQYSCSEHFTTSGHAARHAKKHTGKKDAICPECKKAFTRKDNMEQHRRTHSNNRATPKSSSAEESRQRKVMKLQQQHQKASGDSQTDATATPGNPEMAQQGMPAAIINPHPSTAHRDPLQGMLDPQLRTDQAIFPDMSGNMSSAAFWDQQQMHMPFMQNQGAAPFGGQMSQTRPSMQRSSYRDEIHTNMRVAPLLSSPSASPTSSRGEPQSPSRLDTLAFAASTRLD